MSIDTESVRKRNAEHHTRVRCGDGVTIGEGTFTVIAGPCAVETAEQTLETARFVAGQGVRVFRASIYKPRTSPHTFQGLREGGLSILDAVRTETGLLLDTEVMSPEHVGVVHDHVDILRVGSRGMRNTELLKEVGRTRKPVILKRGMSAALEEWLLAAEYVLCGGNDQVILCERGIRTFETYTRNTLDILAVPALKELTHLPVIVDPSHAAGRASLIPSASRAALAAGADGLLVETHPHPDEALSDGPQSLTFEDFEALMGELRRLGEAVGKPVGEAATAGATS